MENLWRQENGKFVAYTPCLKCHVHNRLTGLMRVYVGMLKQTICGKRAGFPFFI